MPSSGKAFVRVEFNVKNGEVSGYANAPVVDRGDANYRDLIPAETWLKALVEFFGTGAPINFMHRKKFIVGRTKSVEVTSDGPLLVTVPTKEWVKAAIIAGDIKGYSIEYKLFDAELIAPIDGDPRPIRRFKAFSLVRVSYVDEPMNPGSYFIGGKSVNLKDFEIKFDRDAGLVTIVAKSETAMADISSYLADGIKNKSVPVDVREVIGVKAEDDLGDVRYEVRVVEVVVPKAGGLKALFSKFTEDMKGILSTEEDPKKDEKNVSADFGARLDTFLTELKSVDFGEKAVDLSAIETQIAEIKAALPEGEKTLAETLADLQKKAADTSIVTAVEANSTAIKQIVDVVEKLTGGKSSLLPEATKSADQLKEDRWGNHGE